MPSKTEITAFLAQEFPQSKATVESVSPMAATVRLEVGLADLRPGGTVSGPTMMGLADVAMYVALLGEIGIVPLAVTTSLNINFLRKPAAGKALIGECQLMKVGKTLAIGEVSLYSEGSAAAVAHVVATYAIPRAAAPG
jgi:acyl-coenzyme A thioesterase PaaI-like protein